MMSTMQPEPCLGPHGHCFSPLACEAWRYCRERNEGRCPPPETQVWWRTEAAERQAAARAKASING